MKRAKRTGAERSDSRITTIAASRRTFLASAATLWGAGRLVDRAWGAPAVGNAAGNGNESERAIVALYRSLDERQRREICFDWDHRVDIRYGRKPLTIPDPQGVLLRTHVANAWLITPPLLGSEFYTDEQRELVLAVMRTVVTPAWVELLQRQGTVDSGKPWGGDQAVAIFGRPGAGVCQCVVTGFHLTLRASSESNPRAAFDGPITHGHQPSGFYEKVGHPGNIFWPQALKANDLFQLLDVEQRATALQATGLPYYQNDQGIDRTNIVPNLSWDEPRRESDIRFRRSGSPLPGLPVVAMTNEQRQSLEGLLNKLIEPYRAAYQDQVLACLKKQGGLAACRLIYYRQRDLGNDGQWDNWRLEGPALTWFFRGSPHVHIWIHVASDPAAPMTSYFG